MLDWNNPEERATYFREKGSEYRKKNPRLTLTFSPEDYQWVEGSAKHYGADNVSRHVRALAVEAARIGLGKQVEAKPQVPQEVTDELLFLLHNVANNVNQIAYQLNVRSKEEKRSPVAGEYESDIILDQLYEIMRELKTDISSLIPNTQGS